MLQNLHVKNLALIDEAEVDFTKGLNILTGETGAGKSIILGSVNLALGGRYSADLLRRGEQFGLVELTFLIENKVTLEKLKELDVYPDQGQVIISRRLSEGRSVSRINGETVTVSRLKEVAQVLIDIHGQHEHQSLLYKKNHLGILDAFAKGAEEEKKEVASLYQEYKKYQKELEEAETSEADRLKEISFLEFEIEEIENAGLTAEEADEVEENYRRMLNGKKITENLQEALQYCDADENGSAAELLGRTVRTMSEIASTDKKAEELYEQVSELENLLSDFIHELNDYTQSLEFSAEAFYETENRLNEINHLKSKYGNSIEDILEYCKEKKKRLDILKDYDDYLDRLKAELAKTEEKLKIQCDKLSALRKKEAKKLEKMIIEGLKELNFLDVKFEIHFEKIDHFTSLGTDDVEFMISMNPGEKVKPLSEVASGGELSRIMLALKAVMADKDEIETLIFDEIDVGISGRTAQKVSEKMCIIGKKHQVICITHLAQIASMADTHFLIEKSAKNNVTTTTIRPLDPKNSILELARILGGAQITDTVIQSAKEMKELATQLKK